MTEEQFLALLAYIDARISEKIADAFGRADCADWIRTNSFENDLRKALGLNQ
jgi:hypothetical protein